MQKKKKNKILKWHARQREPLSQRKSWAGKLYRTPSAYSPCWFISCLLSTDFVGEDLKSKRGFEGKPLLPTRTQRMREKGQGSETVVATERKPDGQGIDFSFRRTRHWKQTEMLQVQSSSLINRTHLCEGSLRFCGMQIEKHHLIVMCQASVFWASWHWKVTQEDLTLCSRTALWRSLTMPTRSFTPCRAPPHAWLSLCEGPQSRASHLV